MSTPTIGRVLVVCQMNICRSPSAALMLADAVKSSDRDSGAGIRIASAGLTAVTGSAYCDLAIAHAGRRSTTGRSRSLTPAMTRSSDIILVATAKQRTAVLQLMDEESQVPVLPLRWFAGCESTPASVDWLEWIRSCEVEIAATSPAPSQLPYGPLDIPDPHVLGMGLHTQSAAFIRESCRGFARSLQREPARS